MVPLVPCSCGPPEGAFSLPYRLQQSGSGWVVVNSETGKPKSNRPLPRARALAQMRALYANNPEATKAAGHTGVMLALFIPVSALPRVVEMQAGLPNPEPADDLHLTLAYLGSSDRLIEQRPYLERMLRDVDWVQFGLPLAGQIGGIGRFHHDEGDGRNAVYASFDAPGLPAFRQRLIDQLKMHGIQPAENHGFTPHITLAYVPTDTDISTLPQEPIELVFGALTLAWRDERIEFGPGARYKASNFSARAGETIAGNLGRAGNGQFTRSGSGGNAPSAVRPTGSTRPSTRRSSANVRPSSRPVSTVVDKPADTKPGKGSPQQPAAGTRTRSGANRAAQTNRRRVAAELKQAGTGVGPRSMAALDALRTGTALTPEHTRTLDLLAKTGMVSKAADGTFALTDAGTAFLTAADKGDAKAARAAISAIKPPEQITKLPERKPAKQPALTVTKDAGGRYRWLLCSSTSFRDRDGEIVSTKALADDVARADTDGDFGPLRWWHVPGLDIGDCDFNAMHGRTLIESGTFRDEAYAPLIAAKSHELGVSIGFKHAATDPDADGVYHRIRRFERSILPVGYPANLYTAVHIQENTPVDEAKKAALKGLGVTDEMIAALESNAASREKAAEQNGITFKEADAPVVETPVEVVVEHADGEAEIAYFGDMTLSEAEAWIAARNQPVLDAINGLRQTTATKEAREQATQVALKATQDALTLVQSTLTADRQAIDARLTQALTAIKELQGDMPAAVKRASQDPNTVVSPQVVETVKGPAADPIDHFTSGFLSGQAVG